MKAGRCKERADDEHVAVVTSSERADDEHVAVVTSSERADDEHVAVVTSSAHFENQLSEVVEPTANASHGIQARTPGLNHMSQPSATGKEKPPGGEDAGGLNKSAIYGLPLISSDSIMR